MDKNDVARVLTEIAAFLELQGESTYRVRAYRAAARAISAYPRDVRHALHSGALAEVKGIGSATLDIIEEVLNTGHSTMLAALRAQVPHGLVEMLRVAGLGVAKVRQIHEVLDIDSLDELEAAARDGRLATLTRFGPRTAERVLRGISALRHEGGYRLFHHARDEARALVSVLTAMPAVRRVDITGAVRRCRETIRHLEFVIEIDGPVEPVYERLGAAPGVREWVHADERAVTLTFHSGMVADLQLSSPEQYGFQLVRSTGNVDHVAALMARAAARGLRWTDGGLLHEGMPLPMTTESDCYEALGLPWIPPELREGIGEIEAAAGGALPDLVTREDIIGFLHCHTNYSDGSSPIEDWATACAGAGFRYVGITDHSQASTYSGGLAPDAIARQHAEIDAVNRRHRSIRILKGVEADILADGSLDYTPAIRARFDFIIGSLHDGYGMDASAMTQRVLTAMDDPTMTIFGHPTGRLLLSRDPFPMDLDRIFDKAADRGVAIEINADPQRLDLDWRVLRQATSAGVTISIGADAHHTAGMSNIDIGIGIARKGWLTATQVLNTRPTEGFLAFADRAGA
ncbi:MAG TPA: DNA polymerase/3'-5' exonuclease PolX [Gemmatimonadales bacterium]